MAYLRVRDLDPAKTWYRDAPGSKTDPLGAISLVVEAINFNHKRITRLDRECPLQAELVWVQEEPLNAGAWSYVRPRIEMVAGRCAERSTTGPSVRYVGRRPSAAPATGLMELHKLELEELLREAMK